VSDPVAAEKGARGVVVIGWKSDRTPTLDLPMKHRLAVDVLNAK
jgi:hypothetical protein